MTLRKWILKIHLYGGLLCFWYLIIFAISSLQFQHHFKFMLPGNGSVTTREKEINLEANKDTKAFALSLQNNLGIAGWLIPWKTSRDSLGTFHTAIQNPKAGYALDYEPSTSKVTITETGNGFWRYHEFTSRICG